jgi:hypothetical protein
LFLTQFFSFYYSCVTIQKRYHWSNQKRKTVSGTIHKRYHWSNQKRKTVRDNTKKIPLQ